MLVKSWAFVDHFLVDLHFDVSALFILHAHFLLFAFVE